jgi:Tfp pilus assembly protein PilV
VIAMVLCAVELLALGRLQRMLRGGLGVSGLGGRAEVPWKAMMMETAAAKSQDVTDDFSDFDD